jgi:hypothetical protein
MFKKFQDHPELVKSTFRFQKQSELQEFINQDQNLQELITTFDGQVEIS